MNDSVIDTFTQKLSIKATEYTDDFIFEVINHYCEEVSKIKVSKEYLRQVLTKSVPLSVIEDIKADIRAIEMEGPIDDRARFIRGGEEVRHLVLEIIDKHINGKVQK